MKTYSSLAEQSRGGEEGVRGEVPGRGRHCSLLVPPPQPDSPANTLPAFTLLHGQWTLFAIPTPLGWCLLLGALIIVACITSFPKAGTGAASRWALTLLSFPGLAENRTPHLREFWPFPNVCWLPLSFLKASYWCLALIGKCKQEIDKG